MLLQHPSIWVGGLVNVFDWQLSSLGKLTTPKLRNSVNKRSVVTVAYKLLSLIVSKEHKRLSKYTRQHTERLVSNHWSSGGKSSKNTNRYVCLYQNKHGRQPAACTVYIKYNLCCKGKKKQSWSDDLVRLVVTLNHIYKSPQQSVMFVLAFKHFLTMK